MKRIRYPTLCAALLVAACALPATLAAADFRIKVPPGMRMLSRQVGDAVELSFVPVRDEPVAESTDGVATSLGAGERASPSTERPSPAALLSQEVKALNFDRPLSAVPAFVALDASPETVDAPSTPREFAASLLNGADRNGKLQTGLALQFAPYQIFAGPNTTIEQYRESYLTRLLYNTNVSLATIKASEDNDHAQRLALGVSITLLDRGDPRLDPAVSELFRAVNEEIPPFRPTRRNTSASDLEADRARHYAKYSDPNAAYMKGLQEIEGVRARSWGRTSWHVAAAPTWVSASGKADDLAYEGLVAWSTFAFGFEDTALENRMQLLGHLRFREGELVTDATRSATQDTLLAAARLRWGRSDLNFSAEAAYLRHWSGLDGDRNASRYSLGLEKRIAENVWLSVTAGEEFGGGSSSTDELFAIGALRFGSSDRPNFAR